MTDGDRLAGLLLLDAFETVTGSRDTHGDAVENSQHIAQAWNWYLHGRLPEGEEITGADVDRMMQLLKLSRTVVGDYDVDHDRDALGYGGIAAAVEVEEGRADVEDLVEHADSRAARMLQEEGLNSEEILDVLWRTMTSQVGEAGEDIEPVEEA